VIDGVEERARKDAKKEGVDENGLRITKTKFRTS